MTFYVRIKAAPQLPKPILMRDECFLSYGTTSITGGGTLEVDKGATVSAYYGVRNDGGDGKIAVQLWDTKNNKEVLRKEFNLAAGDYKISLMGTFTVNNDMDLVFYAYYWDGTKWVQTDSYGSPGAKRDFRGYL